MFLESDIIVTSMIVASRLRPELILVIPWNSSNGDGTRAVLRPSITIHCDVLSRIQKLGSGLGSQGQALE